MIIGYLKQYFTELFNLTNAMAPYLLLGFMFAGILHVFFKKEQIARLLGSKKVKSSIYASLIGVPLPLCSCGVIPTGISIYKSGASKGSTVSFLISTPQTGVDSILATYSMLGLPYAILRPFIAFVSGIIGGSITNLIDKETEHPTSQTFTTESDTGKKNLLYRMFHYAFVESLQDIAKWLIIGLLIATVISVLLPPDFFQTYIKNDLLGMLIILLVAVPLYICATGSIPIAAVLLMKGISPGAALVFLMAGPATNAATITVLGKVMGRKALTGYLVSIIGSALAFGILVDTLLPREWFTSIMVHNHNHEHGLPFWLELGSTISLILLILNIYSKKLIKRVKPSVLSTNSTEENSNHPNINGFTVIKVKGLDCASCKTNIEKSLASVKGVEWVEADIESSTVKIKGKDFDQKLIKNAVESIGHAYLGNIEAIKTKRMENFQFIVKGMSCSHCKANVEKSIKSIGQVKNVDVNLETSIVVVEGENLTMDELKKKVEDVGYEWGGLKLNV